MKLKKVKKQMVSLLLCAAMLCEFAPQGLALEAETASDGLCAHHTEHTAECGYTAETEDAAGTPCTYVCGICGLQKLIDALPTEITEENQTDAEAQLDAIDEEKAALSEDELSEVDFAKYTAAVAALEALAGQANASEPAAAQESETDTEQTAIQKAGNRIRQELIALSEKFDKLNIEKTESEIKIEGSNRDLAFTKKHHTEEVDERRNQITQIKAELLYTEAESAFSVSKVLADESSETPGSATEGGAPTASTELSAEYSKSGDSVIDTALEKAYAATRNAYVAALDGKTGDSETTEAVQQIQTEFMTEVRKGIQDEHSQGNSEIEKALKAAEDEYENGDATLKELKAKFDALAEQATAETDETKKAELADEVEKAKNAYEEYINVLTENYNEVSELYNEYVLIQKDVDDARMSEAELLYKDMWLSLDLAYLKILNAAENAGLDAVLTDQNYPDGGDYNDADFQDGTEFHFTATLKGIKHDWKSETETIYYGYNNQNSYTRTKWTYDAANDVKKTLADTEITVIRDGKAYSAKTDENGSFSFTLKAGDTIRIKASADILIYTVKEEKQDGYALVSWQQGSGEKTTGETFEGAVSVNTTDYSSINSAYTVELDSGTVVIPNMSGIIVVTNARVPEAAPTATPTATSTATPTATPAPVETVSATATPSAAVPQTGDNSPVELWVVLACFSLFGMAACIILKKRTGKNREEL